MERMKLRMTNRRRREINDPKPTENTLREEENLFESKLNEKTSKVADNSSKLAGRSLQKSTPTEESSKSWKPAEKTSILFSKPSTSSSNPSNTTENPKKPIKRPASPVIDDSLADFKSPKLNTGSNLVKNTTRLVTLKQQKRPKTHSTRTTRSSRTKSSSESNQLSLESSFFKPSTAFVCPLCLKSFNEAAAQISHSKSCASRNHISTKKLIAASALQERQAEERRAIGLPAGPVQQVKKKSSSVKRPKSSSEADVELAIALSKSLSEAQEAQDLDDAMALVAENDEKFAEMSSSQRRSTLVSFGFITNKPVADNVDTFVSKHKKKKILGRTVLQTRTQEVRDRLLAEKIAEAIVDNVMMTQNAVERAVDKESELNVMDFKSEMLKSMHRADRDLWNRSRKQDIEDCYYVKELERFIGPKIECKKSRNDEGRSKVHLSEISEGLECKNRDGFVDKVDFGDNREEVSPKIDDNYHEEEDSLLDDYEILPKIHEDLLKEVSLQSNGGKSPNIDDNHHQNESSALNNEEMLPIINEDPFVEVSFNDKEELSPKIDNNELHEALFSNKIDKMPKVGNNQQQNEDCVLNNEEMLPKYDRSQFEEASELITAKINKRHRNKAPLNANNDTQIDKKQKIAENNDVMLLDDDKNEENPFNRNIYQQNMSPLARSWQKMINSSACSDVIIIVKNKKVIFCHFLIFWTRCRKLKEDCMSYNNNSRAIDQLNDQNEEFNRNFSEIEPKYIVFWEDIGFEAAIIFLEFIYCNSVINLDALNDISVMNDVQKLSYIYETQELNDFLQNFKHFEVKCKMSTSIGEVRYQEIENSSSSKHKNKEILPKIEDYDTLLHKNRSCEVKVPNKASKSEIKCGSIEKNSFYEHRNEDALPKYKDNDIPMGKNKEIGSKMLDFEIRNSVTSFSGAINNENMENNSENRINDNQAPENDHNTVIVISEDELDLPDNIEPINTPHKNELLRVSYMSASPDIFDGMEITNFGNSFEQIGQSDFSNSNNEDAKRNIRLNDPEDEGVDDNDLLLSKNEVSKYVRYVGPKNKDGISSMGDNLNDEDEEIKEIDNEEETPLKEVTLWLSARLGNTSFNRVAENDQLFPKNELSKEITYNEPKIKKGTSCIAENILSEDEEIKAAIGDARLGIENINKVIPKIKSDVTLFIEKIQRRNARFLESDTDEDDSVIKPLKRRNPFKIRTSDDNSGLISKFWQKNCDGDEEIAENKGKVRIDEEVKKKSALSIFEDNIRARVGDDNQKIAENDGNDLKIAKIEQKQRENIQNRGNKQQIIENDDNMQVAENYRNYDSLLKSSSGSDSDVELILTQNVKNRTGDEDEEAFSAINSSSQSDDFGNNDANESMYSKYKKCHRKNSIDKYRNALKGYIDEKHTKASQSSLNSFDNGGRIKNSTVNVENIPKSDWKAQTETSSFECYDDLIENCNKIEKASSSCGINEFKNQHSAINSQKSIQTTFRLSKSTEKLQECSQSSFRRLKSAENLLKCSEKNFKISQVTEISPKCSQDAEVSQEFIDSDIENNKTELKFADEHNKVDSKLRNPRISAINQLHLTELSSFDFYELEELEGDEQVSQNSQESSQLSSNSPIDLTQSSDDENVTEKRKEILGTGEKHENSATNNSENSAKLLEKSSGIDSKLDFGDWNDEIAEKNFRQSLSQKSRETNFEYEWNEPKDDQIDEKDTENYRNESNCSKEFLATRTVTDVTRILKECGILTSIMDNTNKNKSIAEILSPIVLSSDSETEEKGADADIPDDFDYNFCNFSQGNNQDDDFGAESPGMDQDYQLSQEEYQEGHARDFGDIVTEIDDGEMNFSQLAYEGGADNTRFSTFKSSFSLKSSTQHSKSPKNNRNMHASGHLELPDNDCSERLSQTSSKSRRSTHSISSSNSETEKSPKIAENSSNPTLKRSTSVSPLKNNSLRLLESKSISEGHFGNRTNFSTDNSRSSNTYLSKKSPKNRKNYRKSEIAEICKYLGFSPSKVKISFNVQPRENYSKLCSFELNRKLATFGLKKQKHYRAVKLLNFIYDEMHPLVPKSLVTDLISNDTEITENAKEIRHFDELMVINDENSAQSDHEDDNELPKNDYFPEEMDFSEDDGNDGPSIAENSEASLKENFKRLLEYDRVLYRKILMYEPISLDIFIAKLEKMGVKVKSKLLVDFLNSECISFYIDAPKKWSGSIRKRHKK